MAQHPNPLFTALQATPTVGGGTRLRDDEETRRKIAAALASQNDGSLFTNLTSPDAVGGQNTGLEAIRRALGGAPRTSDRIGRVGEALIRQGSSGAPIQSFTQGLNRLAQGFTGGQQLRQARALEEQARQRAGQQKLQLAQAKAQAKAGEGATFGKTGAVFTDQATGQAFTVQFDDQGGRRIMPVEFEGSGLQPSRPVQRVDTGTGTQVISGATGVPLRTVPKDLAGAACQKEQGTTQGEAIGKLPGIEQQVATARDVIDQILTDPQLREGFGGSLGLSGLLLDVSPAARDFGAKVKQVGGTAFLQAFQQLKGGGHITEIEGQKATEATARLDTAQSKEGFTRAIKELDKILERGLQNARRAARGGRSVSTPSGPASGSAAGRRRRFNPVSGEIE